MSAITATRVQRQARNAANAQGAFIAKGRLQALSDEHFNVHPDKLIWADVGTLRHYAELLRRITDCAFPRASTPRPLGPAASPPPAGLRPVEGRHVAGPAIGDATMTPLTETQSLALSRAAQRDGGIALPLPERLKGGAAKRVVGPLIEKGLLEEVGADLRKCGQPLWRSTGHGHGVTLTITRAGLEAVGVETGDSAPGAADEAPSDPAPAKDARATRRADTAAESAGPRAPREGTKLAKLVELLRQPEGATIAEMTEATGWQQHTVRGALAASVKKKLGLEVVSEKPQGQDRRWRIGL
jgi:hypothetical protein